MDRSGSPSVRRCSLAPCRWRSGSGSPGRSGSLIRRSSRGDRWRRSRVGLMILAALWAAIGSGGRSSFTPVAVGFAVAIALAVVRREDVPGRGLLRSSRWPSQTKRPRPSPGRKSLILTRWPVPCSSSCGPSIRVDLAPSPRDGVQPVEFRTDAFYAVLGEDLATTGTETNTSPSGFSEPDRSPGPDLVPLGRTVAGGGRHHDPRGPADAGALPRRVCPCCCSPQPR